ncbi:MAG TPA: hypothetical protein VH164_11645 [Ktedonobacteraceae bacterium]|nr:hypothetical protein [Ktedonobacteraceae bacterium]
MMKRVLQSSFFSMAALAPGLALAACGSAPTVNAVQPQQTDTISAGFQARIPPIPTVEPYRCGAWTSTNAPGPGATIKVYSRLTHNNLGVPDIAATADVHFQSGDVNLAQSTSDAGGYVSFTLPLMGRQPAKVPATVDVTFTGTPNGSLTCTTFFTPR